MDKKDKIKKDLLSILYKMQECENGMNSRNPKHIITYNKILGIKQKILQLDKYINSSDMLWLLGKINLVIFNFRNGVYDKGMSLFYEIKEYFMDCHGDKNTFFKKD